MPRPAKHILLLGRDEDELLVRQFVLRVWGYEVALFTDAERALLQLAEGRVDVLITDAVLPGDVVGNAVCRRVLALCAEQVCATRTLLLTRFPPTKLYADAHHLPTLSSAELLGTVEQLAARRRGPKHAQSAVAELLERMAA